MTIRFTQVGEEHLGELLQIYDHYVLHSTATFHEHRLTETEMRRLLFFENPRHQSFTIWEEAPGSALIVGYCLIHRFHEREAYDGTGTISIYLKPGQTGKGYGSAAIRFLEDYARERQFHVLMAIICQENEESVRLFERRGFTLCGHFKEVGRKFGRLLDVVYYQKVLEG